MGVLRGVVYRFLYRFGVSLELFRILDADFYVGFFCYSNVGKMSAKLCGG